MSTKQVLHTQSSYMDDLRDELFSSEPLKQLLEVMIFEIDQEIITEHKDYYFVSDCYNWHCVRVTCEHIISACGETPAGNILVCAWECLPRYLDAFSIYH